MERQQAQERHAEADHLRGVALGYEQERDEWKARAEAAEADNAELWNDLLEAHEVMAESWPGRAIVTVLAATLAETHPGAALLEERKRIAKMLDTMDVPSEADEAEKGRACDFAGRVELLATWGQRGWREYRKAKDSEAALLERLRAAEKVVEAAKDLSAHEDYTIDLEPGCDTTPDDPRGLNAARRSVHGALAAYDATKEGT